MKISKKEVEKALKNFQSSEPEHDGTIVYYLHITEDGELVSDYADADETYTATLSEEAYSKYPADYDWRDEVEVESNPYFMEVVESLYEKAIAGKLVDDEWKRGKEVEPLSPFTRMCASMAREMHRMQAEMISMGKKIF